MPPSPASEELALAALEWIAATAVADGDGVWWSGKPSSDEPDPTPYHGSAGIVLALLEAEAHFGDGRWGDLALRGTRWLAGAAGADAASGGGWRALVDRCWQTVITSGLPERVRPGFWDNCGRCCGTGGVLALACDREVENGDGRAFADLLVADLGRRRARVDADGARWSNVEYRGQPARARASAGLGDGQRRVGQGAAAARADHGRARSVRRGPVARPPRSQTGGS